MTDETKKADLNEAFNCGYEPELDTQRPDGAQAVDSSLDSAMQGSNAWPSQAGFKTGVAAYYGQVLALARRLMRLFASALELPTDFFDSVVTQPGAMLRLLKYPAQDPSRSDALGIGAHTDIECFTILAQGTQPALQILNVDGHWIQAPPVPGTFVVNIGGELSRLIADKTLTLMPYRLVDMLARWSNDKFISTVHRVLNITGEERYSVPFFFGPSYDTILRPLRTCVGEGTEAKYEPVKAGDYVYQRLTKSRLSKEEAETKSLLASGVAAA